MKKIPVLTLVILILLSIAPKGLGKETVWQQNSGISFSGGKRTVNAVYVNLNDKTIRMESVLAKNQVGQTDDLKSIAEQLSTKDCQVMGAINGTFFNSYSDQQPLGTIQTRGDFVHLDQKGSIIGFRGDNSVAVENLYTFISGNINGSYDYPNNWSAWGFNHKYDRADANAVFTSDFGKTTGKHNKTSIVVDRGVVIKICKGEAPIPSDGFTIVTGSQTTSQRFDIGDKVSYRLEYYKSIGGLDKGSPVSWDNMRTSVGAGPTLVKAGKIIADGKLEGFAEDKINKNRAQRSFAGVTKDNTLILGTVPNVTIKELAEIVRNLGIVDGINLDGGASSGLYYNGKYVTNPGRKLSNALVITKLKNPPPRLQLNGKDLYYKHDPYITSTNTLMIPATEAFKDFGAISSSGASNKAFTVERYDQSLMFSAGSDTAKMDGSDVKLPHPVEIKGGQSYIPAQLIADAFGGTYNWNNKQKTACISMDTVNADDLYMKANKAMSEGNSSGAEEMYRKVLELDSTHAGALLKLGPIYSQQKMHDRAAECYEKFLKIKPKDTGVRWSYGWACYSSRSLDKAIEAFIYLTKVKPDSASYWIALGTMYNDYSVRRYDDALMCFDKALALKPTAAQLQTIEKQKSYALSNKK